MFGVGVGVRVGGRTASSGGGFDPDAQAFFDRVTTAGGTLSTTEKNATNQLVLDMKSAGIWSSMKAIYPMVGASAAACAQNLKSSSFTGTFSSGWTFASTGVTPNGTSAYMDTNFNPSIQLSGTSAHASLYPRTSLVGGYGIQGDFSSRMDIINFSGTLYSAMGTTGQTSYTGTYAGLIVGSRTSSTSNKLYVGGTLRDTKTASSTANFQNLNYWLGACNLNTFYSSNQCAFASIGDGLTDTQASNFYTAVQTFNQTLNRQVGAQIVSDADAQAYINRVYTAGGTLTNTEANAVNQLTIDMKAAGIWTAMKAVYPMVGSSAAACAQNLKSSSFTGTFSSGWTFASTGVTPNGTSAYMDTGLNALSNLTLTSTHLSAYVRNNTLGSQYDLGCSADISAYSNATALITRYFNNTSYIEIGGGGYGTSTSMSNSQGFTFGTTNGSRVQNLYKNGTLIVSSSSNANNFANKNVYLGAINGGGTPTFFSDKQYALCSIGDGLDATQQSNFYTAVQTFNQTLNRQIAP